MVFAPGFVVEGVMGRQAERVLDVLENKFKVGQEYGLRKDFDNMFVCPLAGHRFTRALSKYEQLDMRSITQVM